MTLPETPHISALPEDFLGNNGSGRYIFLTGSDERARDFGTHFQNLIIREHPRHHNFYMGNLTTEQGKIDVAAISTGMGGPSADIIINELILLGAKRLLRIGTAGSLLPQQISVGDIVVATAAVRDDKASWDYIYREYPAVASIECLIAAHRAASLLTKNINIHFGIVHSKSSLYAREYNFSLLKENEDYMTSLKNAGVLASEMECAQLFTLTSLMSGKYIKQNSPAILCGGILAIIGDKTSFSDDKKKIKSCIQDTILYALEVVREWYLMDQKKKNHF